MVKGPAKGMNLQNGENKVKLKKKVRSRSGATNTMDSFQDGGQHMNTEHINDYQSNMEGSYMNPDMNNFGHNPGDQGMVPDSFGRMNEGMHPGQIPQYNSFGRQQGYSNMEGSSMGGSEYSNPGGGYGGQYQPSPGVRPGYPGGPTRPGMSPVRPGMGSHGGMGMMPAGYSPNQQRMMSGQSISQQTGPTPTLNQLLQTPNSQPRYPQNSFDGYSGQPQKGGDMAMPNGPYGMSQGWMQGQRGGMGNYQQMPISGSSPYRGQGPPNYNQQGFNQSGAPINSQSQYTSQGSIQQQPQPPGQPPGSSPQQQQRPTPQPSPHQQISPAPSPIQRVTPDPSPGPQRPQPQPSPGQQRSLQPSPSPSQRSTSSQLSPPGSSPGLQNNLQNSQHNHLSSPKESSVGEDVKGELNQSSSSSRPEASPGSVGSRSNTPASVSGSSPMPPRPPSQQDGQTNIRMSSQSPMPAPGYNPQMMPPPHGPNQMGGYSQGANKMGPGPAGPYPPHYQNSQYPPQSGNYGMRQPNPGMGNYAQNMYNGPSQMGGPGGQPMYNSLTGPGPGMNRSNYNMYPGQGSAMGGMNNQYGSYSPGGPGQNSQGVSGPVPTPPTMGSPGPSSNGPPGNMNSMVAGSSGANGHMSGPPGQGQTPIKSAQAAAQAALAAARSQQAPTTPVRQGVTTVQQQPQRMYSPNTMGPHSMPPQSMSPLSQMGQMNQMGYSSTMNNMPHPQNSVSPVPNAMGHSQNMPVSVGKMHNNTSVNNYNDQQPLPRSKSSKSKSVTNTNLPPSSIPNNLQQMQQDNKMGNCSPSPLGGVASPSVTSDPLVPSTQQLPSSTPTSSLSDASSHSNDSSSMGPVINNDNSAGPHMGPISDNSVSTSGNEAQREAPMGVGSGEQQHPVMPTTTTAHTSAIETNTAVTQSITSPVTSISTEAGNSNDSQPIPMEPITAIQNCIPAQPTITEEPPEKKRKTTEGISLSQLPFARVAPSPDGVSVASSGTHDDIENIGSPGWPGTPKSSEGYMKLYEMGMEPGRKPFLDQLFSFLEEKGTPISIMPVISKQPLDLYRLYQCVQEKGGMTEVTKAKKWKEVCGLVNISGSASAAFTLKKNYIKFLFAFECRYERGGMDPTPILAQMENELEKKRAAKQRNRAPSPGGSQNSQDGMAPGANQYMQNDPNMAPHMGQGMMGNHMMNNMGQHGGPMMGPNNMGGPHPMGPGGMQGPGHMMGGMGGPQGGMMPGNSGYMMPGGPNNMMGNNMGPQGGMMGPGGMQGPNNMMGNMGPQSGNHMPNNINQQHMMGPNNMNMPNNNMMGPNNMMPGGIGHQPGGMMPSNNMNPQQMMRNNMNQPGGAPTPSQGPVPSQGPQGNTGPQGGPTIPPTTVRGSDSVTCSDPFSDEPSFSRANSGGQMPPFPGMPMNNSGMPQQSNSPLPQNSGPVSVKNEGNLPTNTSSMSMPQNNTEMQMSSSAIKSEPQTSQPSQQQQQIIKQEMPSNATMSSLNSDMPPNSGMMSNQQSSMQSQNSGSFTNSAASISSANMSSATTTSSMSQPSMSQPPNMFSQDSNSNSSMPDNLGNSRSSSVECMPPQHQQQQMPMPHQQNMPPQHQQMPQQNMPPQGMPGQPNMPQQNMSGQPNMPQQNMLPQQGMPGQPNMPQQNMPGQPNMLPQSMGQYQTGSGPMPYSQMPMAPNGQSNSSSQLGNTTNTSSASGSGRQFPFGDQFSKPDRFEQSSPSMSQQSGGPTMSQAPMVNQQPMMNQPPQSNTNQPPYMPQPQPMTGDGPVPGGMPGRYGNQMPPSGPTPEHFNQGYHGNQPGYSGGPPRPPMMNDQFNQPGYPNQQGPYGKPPMNRDMSGSIYNTPNKRFPDNRGDSYMSPAINAHRGSIMSFDGPIPYTHSRPYPDYGVENNMAYGSQGYSSSPGMSYTDSNMSHQYMGDYNAIDTTSGHMSDRRDPNQWSSMPPQRGYHGVPPYGPSPAQGMGPSGPPNMSHGSRVSRMMSPNRNREFTMSPNHKQKMASHGMHGHYKKDMLFPNDTVESTQPLMTKRRRLTKHDIGPLGYKYIQTGSRSSRNRGISSTGQIEAWRIMMTLKSGLLAESTWALDTLNILLIDDSTVAYFGLGHLPGLLEVLLDHFRKCLMDMFQMFDDTQIGCGHDDFKQNLIRMAILESTKENINDSKIDEEANILKRANRNIVKHVEESTSVHNSKENSVEKEPEKTEKEKTPEIKSEKCENNEKEPEKTEGEIDSEKEVEKIVVNDMAKDLKSRTNYTFLSRQGKEVKVEENSDPNGLLDDKYWDVYCEFGDQSELWEYGKGDLTEHIKTHLEDLDELKRCKKKFYRKPMKLKDPSELIPKVEIKQEDSETKDEKLPDDEEAMETDSSNNNSDTVNDVDSKSPPSLECQVKLSENGSDKTDCSSDKCGCEKDNHSCNSFLNGITIKSEPRDLIMDKPDSVNNCDEVIEERTLFKDEPRIKLAVKYELLDSDELVQVCKNSFGINTEGERNNMEDESYQRNEPPLCLTTEAQTEIGRRCLCISNIIRSLSYIPGNDLEMSRHAGLVYILGELLLLHHKHLPRCRVRRKFDREDIEDPMVDTTQGVDEWWWDYLNVLRENTLVIFANISAQLRLDIFPDEVCKPVLNGLLHWAVCPSSCATDPLPTVSSSSVLSPLRLVLEAMCKLCIHDKNVDMLIATPPYERIVQLFSVLTKLLSNNREQVTVEFSIVLLSELVKGGSSAARGVALQHPSISLLIDFLETAEQKAVQVANMHSIQMLRDNPEMMGTSLDMLRRAATVLLHLAKVPDNRKLFIHHQSRLLSLVMSQILDQTVASILSDVLYQCSQWS